MQCGHSLLLVTDDTHARGVASSVKHHYASATVARTPPPVHRGRYNVNDILTFLLHTIHCIIMIHCMSPLQLHCWHSPSAWILFLSIRIAYKLMDMLSQYRERLDMKWGSDFKRKMTRVWFSDFQRKMQHEPQTSVKTTMNNCETQARVNIGHLREL